MYEILRNSFHNIPLISVDLEISPIIYEGSEVLATVQLKSKSKRKMKKQASDYDTNINPSRIITGPLSEYGEELENPIKDEYEEFLRDCEWLIKNSGFTIISSKRSQDSKKSQYFILFGMEDAPCGSLVFNLRVSDHNLSEFIFRDEDKDKVRNYLTINHILSGDAADVGIDFAVYKVTIGSIKFDTWNKAFNRLGDILDKLRNKVRKQLKRNKRK